VTSTPLRPSEGPACQVRCLEGRARRVRLLTFDHPFRFAGHDERAPPSLPSEGPGCQVRWATMDDPLRFIGHDGHPPDFGWVAHTLLHSGPPAACLVRNEHFCYALHSIELIFGNPLFGGQDIWGRCVSGL